MAGSVGPLFEAVRDFFSVAQPDRWASEKCRDCLSFPCKATCSWLVAKKAAIEALAGIESLLAFEASIDWAIPAGNGCECIGTPLEAVCCLSEELEGQGCPCDGDPDCCGP